ncbi:hypothetical protein EXE46_08930 [Halorubrum sp. GN11_10-6_MGM]|uniref:hypothetical protein n=1 Tax=Halorubrum sp. GN11_10-6_MGM TaxID=2518112 RepID=UPI0010F8E411|nr:hypothetical protein [Halorubrum sp. GN11_10-6_MGM]TKX74479.1 hypothetical protein EXE46_08930 [Halorubrum sp. GN11_10-6_MGM]
MELTENTLTVSRALSELDKDVIKFTQILKDCNVEYVIVSGYIAILTENEEKASRFSAGMNPTPPFVVHRSVIRLDIPRSSNPSLQVSLFI